MYDQSPLIDKQTAVAYADTAVVESYIAEKGISINPKNITASKVGTTTYIVTSRYKESGETLEDKIWRLISNDRGDSDAD